MGRVGTRAAKDAMFEGLTTAARALASGRRAEIVELLAQGPRTVEQVATAIDQSIANTSHHLRALARAGLVQGRRDGSFVRYGLASPRVFDLWAALRDVAAAHAEGVEALVDAYVGERSELEAIDRAELRRRLERDEVTLIDVRPLVEYEAGHIPGAVPVPVDELDDRLDDLPDDRAIVAYCRGPYCAFADRAVRTLREHGRDAVRLEDGYPEWQREDRGPSPRPPS